MFRLTAAPQSNLFGVCSHALSSFKKAFSPPVRSLRQISKEINTLFVVGPGSIGQALTISLLINHNNQVVLIGKKNQVAALQQNGISLTGAMEKKILPDGKRFIVTDKPDEVFFQEHGISPNPIIFSATKAHDAAFSLLLLNHTAIGKPIVACLQNGFGAEEEVRAAFPNFRVLKASVLGAVHPDGKGSLHVYPGGKILVENMDNDFSEELKRIFGPKDKSIFSLETPMDFWQAIYPKIAVNCTCNPLTVILNQNLGTIREEWEPLIRKICDEVYSVAMAQGVELPSRESLSDFVLTMMSQYPDHHSSMWEDLRKKRRSELKNLNGGLLKIAREKKVDTPLTDLLTNTIKKLEEKWIKCKSVSDFYSECEQFLNVVKMQLDNAKVYPINMMSLQNYRFGFHGYV